MTTARNTILKPLKELADAVDAKIKVEHSDGQSEYVLIDKHGEHVVREYDVFDMLDSIAAYYGSHPNYTEARAQFNYMTGEDN